MDLCFNLFLSALIVWIILCIVVTMVIDIRRQWADPKKDKHMDDLDRELEDKGE